MDAKDRSTTLTVWVYDSAVGAAAGEVRLKDLQELGGLTVHDAITISWFRGAHEPHVGHLRNRRAAAAAKGSVLGALAGAVILAPLAGAAVGAGIGALRHKLQDAGIDPSFLEEVKESLHPGTSALLVLSSDADPDLVRTFVERGFARGDVVLMHARLRDDAPQALRDLLIPAVPRPKVPKQRGHRPSP